MRNLTATGLAAGLLALAAPLAALAQGTDAAMRNAGYIAGNCATCHGTAGMNPNAMPALAGLAKPYFVQQMQAFRGGTRSATIMHQLAKGYTDEQIDALGEYFSRQKAK